MVQRINSVPIVRMEDGTYQINLPPEPPSFPTWLSSTPPSEPEINDAADMLPNLNYGNTMMRQDQVPSLQFNNVPDMVSGRSVSVKTNGRRRRPDYSALSAGRDAPTGDGGAESQQFPFSSPDDITSDFQSSARKKRRGKRSTSSFPQHENLIVWRHCLRPISVKRFWQSSQTNLKIDNAMFLEDVEYY